MNAPKHTPQAERWPACESLRARPWSEKDGFPLSRCTSCGALFAPSAAATATGALYEHYYDQATFDLAPAVRLSLERLVDRFGPYRRTGKLLDIGFGEGALLSVAQVKGWSCHGTELSPGAVEHLARPRSVLESAFRWLRPGGLLFLTTPNGRSLNRWLLGSDWSIFGPPEHMTIWTVRALRRALARSGFAGVRIRTEGLNPCEVLERLGRRRGQSRNESGAHLNETLSRNSAGRGFKRVANGALSALRLGDTLKASAERPAAG